MTLPLCTMQDRESWASAIAHYYHQGQQRLADFDRARCDDMRGPKDVPWRVCLDCADADWAVRGYPNERSK